MDRSSSPRMRRRILMTLFVAQSMTSAAMTGLTAISAIVAAGLGGYDALAGLPMTFLLVGAASAAYPASRVMDRLGRRWGLGLAGLIGSSGMLLAGSAVLAQSFGGFLTGLLLIGSARGALDQGRYVAADASGPERRAQAISMVVFAGTIGAIAGPLLVGPSSAFAAWLGMAPLAGPLGSGMLLYALAGLLLAIFLRDDRPEDTPVAGMARAETASRGDQSRPVRRLLALPTVRMALVTLAGAQAAMVLVMSVTSLHLYHHHGGLADVSLVIILHTLGMFGLSMVSGALADRLGQRAVIGAGVLLLMLGSLLAPLSTATLWLAFALFIIGLGWNLCYIAGSSLLTASLEPIERSRIQGAAELAVNLSSATIGLSSGAIFAVFGYHTLARIGAALMLIPLALMCWQGVAQRKGLAFRPRERAYRAVGRKGEAHHTP